MAAALAALALGLVTLGGAGISYRSQIKKFMGAEVNGDGFLSELDKLNWQQALDFAEGLVFAGHDDWRLPTVEELLTIVDYSRASLALDPVFIQDVITFVAGAIRWSSTSFMDNSNASTSNFAWVVGHGGFALIRNVLQLHSIRAVRTAQ